MKKEKKRKNKLSSLLLLLFLTVVMLSTSTYAWFTANKTVTISSLNVNVATSTGLQIATDATNWKTLIDNTDITAGYKVGTVEDVNMLPNLLVPVSATNTATSGKLSMFKGTVEADPADGIFKLKAAASPEVKGTSGDYIVFDIFLKTDAVENLYLQKGSGVVVTEGKTDVGLQYASRIALVVEGNKAATAAVSEMVALNGGTSVTMFEPNYDGHTANGKTNAELYYSTYTGVKNTQTGDSLITPGTGNAKVSTDAVSKAITTPIALTATNKTNNSEYFAEQTTVVLSDKFSKNDASESNLLLFENFNAGVTKIRVYMWIEGQDVDCENSASGANLTFNLSFTQNA